MRDNHEGMPEFVNAIEKEGAYFGVIAAIEGEREKRFQFGLSLQGYRAPRRVLQDRPFDLMPGLRYRYFYAGSSKRHPEHRYTMSVRLDSLAEAEHLEIAIS